MKLISNLTFDNAIQQYEEKYNCKYYHGQLRELREGFEKGLDIDSYANPDFEHEQMREIRLGLEKVLTFHHTLNQCLIFFKCDKSSMVSKVV